MKKTILFDLDGTLTQSEEGIWNCVRYAAQSLGFAEPDTATLRKFVGPPLSYSFREYLHMPDEIADANGISGEAPGSTDSLLGVPYLLIP